MATNAMSVPGTGGAKLFSGWIVAGLLALHLVTLTVVHYVAGPMLGLSPASPDLIAATIVIGAAVILALVARDLALPISGGGSWPCCLGKTVGPF